MMLEGPKQYLYNCYIFNILEIGVNMLQTMLIQMDIVGVKSSMIVFFVQKRILLVTKLCFSVCFVQGHNIQIPEHLYDVYMQYIH